MAEAVGATLEGRASAMKPQSFNDLIERRRKRIAERGFEMEEVDSSWISSFGYDRSAGSAREWVFVVALDLYLLWVLLEGLAPGLVMDIAAGLSA